MGNDKLTNVLITNQLSVLPKITLPTFRAAKVNMLWLVPISEKERLFANENGKEKLLERLEDIGDTIYSLDREELV